MANALLVSSFCLLFALSQAASLTNVDKGALQKLEKDVTTLIDGTSQYLKEELRVRRNTDNVVDPSLSRLMKRDTKMVQKRPEFMGNSVSVPQYVRLVNLQEATIEMDRYMKKLAMKFSPRVLMSDPSWRELVLIYRSLEKLLPDEVREENKEVVWWN